MCWKDNLARILNDCNYSAIEIHARTGLSTSTISNIQNKLHDSFLCSQFILLKLMLEKTHIEFLNIVFGESYFHNIKTIKEDNDWTSLGRYFKDNNHYEVFSKKKVAEATGIGPSRIDYIFKKNHESIKIDEITKLELAGGKEKGYLCNLFFPNIRLNSDEEYELLLQRQRDINKKANFRRKPKN